MNLKKPSMAPSPSTALVSADTYNHIPAVWMKRLTQNPLFPSTIDLPLNSAIVIDVPCVFNYVRLRDLDVIGLVVIASIDTNVVLAAIAEAPASASLLTQGRIPLKSLEMLDQAVVVVRTAVSVARDIAVNVVLRES